MNGSNASNTCVRNIIVPFQLKSGLVMLYHDAKYHTGHVITDRQQSFYNKNNNNNKYYNNNNKTAKTRYYLYMVHLVTVVPTFGEKRETQGPGPHVVIITFRSLFRPNPSPWNG